MILYFDTFVTDYPLFPNEKMDELLNLIRPEKSIYRNHSKVDIFSYTVDSFINLDFEEILINVEFDSPQDEVKFLDIYGNDNRVKISRKRSASKDEYLTNIRKFNRNSWCLFSPNNDHPFIANDTNILGRLESYANYIENKYHKNTTIFYSHFLENLFKIPSKSCSLNFISRGIKLLEENDDAFVVELPQFEYSSIQILKVGHLLELFDSINEINPKVIRLEDVSNYVNSGGSVVCLIPKSELCRHFDTYIHTIFHYFDYIKPSLVPPLFIPTGYFEKDIKIRFGYDDIHENYVNVNLNKNIYSFEDANIGFDLLCDLSEIPQFWRNRISFIDINPQYMKGNAEAKRNKIRHLPPKYNLLFTAKLVVSILDILNYLSRNYILLFVTKYFWRLRVRSLFSTNR